MSDRIDIYEHSFLDSVVAILLILFFPIGIIVLISRTIMSKNKKEKVERINIETSTHGMVPDALRDYYNLYKEGLISQKEYDKMRNKLLRKGTISKLLDK